MTRKIGMIALVVLCCAAGSVLLAARTSHAGQVTPAGLAAPGAVTSCADARIADAELAASDNRKGGCGPGGQPCPASQVGQPCSPNNLNVLCSAQRNGAYCCLAYAP